jgi:hypothetical protein
VEQDIWKGIDWENAQNVLFSGAGKMRSLLFYMLLWLQKIRVMYKTLTFKNKEKILVVVATKKDVLQQDFKPGTPSIENSCLQVANKKQQTRNSNKTMAHKLTHQQGTIEAQLQNLQNATTYPTAAARSQIFKVESNNNKQHRTNQ